MISTVVNDCLPEKRLFTKSSFSPLFMSALLRRVRAPVSLLSIASQLVSPSVPFLRPPYDFIATSSPNRSQSTGKAQAYRRRGENRWSALEIDWNLMQIIIKEKFLQKFIINYFSSSYELISPFLLLTIDIWKHYNYYFWSESTISGSRPVPIINWFAINNQMNSTFVSNHLNLVF